MKIIEKKISEIHPYENNPRNNDSAVPFVMNSIQEFGFKVPIVIDTEGTIVCGHTRYKAAKKLKMATVPCILADDLNEDQIKAFRLADNRVGEFSEWNMEKLEVEMSELEQMDIDMTLFGFGYDVNYGEEEEEEDADDVEDEPQEVLRCRCPKCGYRFNNDE
jgi:ParB-like chromosome segregation protein Spo0J